MQAAYMVFLTANAPQAIVDTWPQKHWRTLNSTYSAAPYTTAMAELVPDYEPTPVDDVMPTTEEIVPVVAGLMYADTPLLKLPTSECVQLLATPQWRLFAGHYDSEVELIADADAVGMTLTSTVMEEMIVEAKANLAIMFGA